MYPTHRAVVLRTISTNQVSRRAVVFLIMNLNSSSHYFPEIIDDLHSSVENTNRRLIKEDAHVRKVTAKSSNCGKKNEVTVVKEGCVNACLSTANFL